MNEALTLTVTKLKTIPDLSATSPNSGERTVLPAAPLHEDDFI